MLRQEQRLLYGGHVIKPFFTGVVVNDVSVTDNKDGSYIIWFRPEECGTLKIRSMEDMLRSVL